MMLEVVEAIMFNKTTLPPQIMQKIGELWRGEAWPTFSSRKRDSRSRAIAFAASIEALPDAPSTYMSGVSASTDCRILESFAGVVARDHQIN